MSMEFYGMFDYASGDGDTYKYTSAEFSNLILALTGNGVSYNFGNRFAEVSHSGLDIVLGSGAVFINGRYAYDTHQTTLSASAVGAGATRKDTVAAELDLANRIIDLKIIEGTADNFPTLGANQVALFNLTITGGSSSSISAVADVRSFIYTSSIYPSTQIIYSATQPAYVEGAIWLKPTV